MLIKPFKGNYRETQDWNDPRYRKNYYKFNLLGHNGKDYATPEGTEIIAPHRGKVIETALDTYGYGWYIKIENNLEGSILSHFKHKPVVEVGSEIKQGDLVGYADNTGNSTGTHLHWGYYRMPRKRDNGFSGTVDQTHWLNHDCGWDKAVKCEADLVDMRESRNWWRETSKNQKKALGECDGKKKEFIKIAEQNKKLKNELDLIKKESVDALAVFDLLKLIFEKLRWES